jgi:hypothetical protein
MNYEGNFPEEVTPFLKAALMDAYRRKAFIGGRGDFVFTSPDFPSLKYFNTVTNQDGVRLVSGFEVITQEGRGRIGEMRYNAFTLG